MFPNLKHFTYNIYIFQMISKNNLHPQFLKILSTHAFHKFCTSRKIYVHVYKYKIFKIDTPCSPHNSGILLHYWFVRVYNYSYLSVTYFVRHASITNFPINNLNPIHLVHQFHFSLSFYHKSTLFLLISSNILPFNLTLSTKLCI